MATQLLGLTQIEQDAHVEPTPLSGQGDRTAVKRRATTALTAAGREHLVPIGLEAVGRGGRSWRQDHGWWTLRVFFESSSYSVKTGLIVDVKPLWHRASESPFGIGFGGHRKVHQDLHGSLESNRDDGQVLATANLYARSAAEAVARYQRALQDDGDHLRYIADASRAAPERDWDGACANVLLGSRDEAGRMLYREISALQDRVKWGLAQPPRKDKFGALVPDWAIARLRETEALRDLLSEPDDAATGHIGGLIKAGRDAAALPPLTDCLPSVERGKGSNGRRRLWAKSNPLAST